MWLLQQTAGILALTLLVALLCRGLRLVPAARHALWLLVLLKLLMPPFIAWPWALSVLPEGTSISAGVSGAPSNDDIPVARKVEPPVSGHSVVEDDIALSLTDRLESASTPATPRATVPWDRWIDVGAAVWLCGGMVVAFVQMRRLLRVRHGLDGARQAPPSLAAEVERLSALLDVRPPPLTVLPGLGSPLIWAGGRTRLLWPEGLEAELSPEGCRAVLIHELAHLARRDHWVGRLLLLAGCMWWWHPLFYLIRRQLQRQAELACDARVVELLPDARRSYAEALLDVCERQSWTASLAPALGAVDRRRDLERRLVMIMRANVPGRLSLRVLGGIVLLGLISLPTWTLGQDKTTTKPGQIATADKKLQELETKLKALLKEVQDLRGNKPPMGANPTQGAFGSLLVDLDNNARLDVLVADLNAAQAAPQEVTLSRTTYKLPAAKAEALGKFLQEHVKAVIMETKADSDSLTITTTPEVQQGIRQFIALIEGKTSSRATKNLFQQTRPQAK